MANAFIFAAAFISRSAVIPVCPSSYDKFVEIDVFPYLRLVMVKLVFKTMIHLKCELKCIIIYTINTLLMIENLKTQF